MQSLNYPVQSLKKRFWMAVVLTVLVQLLMRFITDGIPSGLIVEFEMAKTVEKAQALMIAWGSDGTTHFIRGIYIDFIFLACYSTALFFGCRYMGHLSGHSIFKSAGYVFSFLALIAGGADILENIGMIYTIKKQAVIWVVHFTYDMAFVKFSLIFIALLFIVICLFFRGIDLLASGRKKTFP